MYDRSGLTHVVVDGGEYCPNYLTYPFRSLQLWQSLEDRMVLVFAAVVDSSKMLALPVPVYAAAELVHLDHSPNQLSWYHHRLIRSYRWISFCLNDDPEL